MLDIKLLRQNPKFVENELAKKGYQISLDEFLEDDKKRREKISESEKLKAEKNKVSAEIPKRKKNQEDCTSIFAEMKALGEKISTLEEELNALELKQKQFLEALPNLPAPGLLAGGKENNKPVHTFGTAPQFDFEPKNHVELAESLGLIDYVRGSKMAGSGFWIYTNKGAMLEWALLNYFVEQHLKDGYEMMLVPHILNYDSGFTAGQFPKFSEDVFWIEEKDEQGQSKALQQRKFILPTAETALVNLYRDEILEESFLPRKLFAYTPCYRKEAGSYRSEERGMIRGHQFNKIEMFQYTKQEDGEKAYQELCQKAAQLVEGLGLHFQLVQLAAGDCSHAMAKTMDVEIWLPSMNIYKEVSSVSWAGDYQARRGNIRYRDAEGKLQFAHTLNGSGLATSRVFPALLEQLQEKDGRVRIPEVLRKYMGGLEYLEVEKA